MNKIYGLISWVVALTIVAAHFTINQYLGGWLVTSGMIVGAMVFVGFPAWTYYKSTMVVRERLRSMFFSKNFLSEWATRTMLMVLWLVLSLLEGAMTSIFMFLLGIFIIAFVEFIVEVLVLLWHEGRE